MLTKPMTLVAFLQAQNCSNLPASWRHPAARFGSACDGFVIAGGHVPGSYEDFARLVVPELQRRGLFHEDYTGSTLRENLGIPAPRIGA